MSARPASARPSNDRPVTPQRDTPEASASRNRGARTTARASLAVGVVLAVLAAVAAAVGVRFNYTESLPRGLYLASAFDPSEVRRGALVAACPTPQAARALADYLPDGPCPGGTIELGKRVVGLPGDRVVLDSAGVSVGGQPVPHSAPLFRDRRGRPLSPVLGEVVLGPGAYWLHSGRVATSIDSRYVGPVTDIRSSLRPLWVED